MTLLLDLGLPVDAPDAHHRETALFSAAREGNFQAVKVLLDRGADVNGHVCSENDDDDTYNHEREENNYDDYGSNSDYDSDSYCTPGHSITPLYCTLKTRNGEIAMLLIDRGADTTTPGGVLRSLVSYAVKHNLKDIVDKLGGINLSDDGNVIHEIKGDDTLLKSKALIGEVDSMRAILKTGVEVNFKDMNGDTVLACVLDNRDNSHAMEIVKVLLQFGADVDTKNDRWETPLLIAVRINLENVAELLLELGCDAKARDLDSCCSLRYAAQNDNGKLTEMLLKFGADASLKTDRDEVTPLHMAVSSNSYHTAFTLLKHGCDLEVTNSLGRTANSMQN